jgi:hypothetical protein
MSYISLVLMLIVLYSYMFLKCTAVRGCWFCNIMADAYLILFILHFRIYSSCFLNQNKDLGV